MVPETVFCNYPPVLFGAVLEISKWRLAENGRSQGAGKGECVSDDVLGHG